MRSKARVWTTTLAFGLAALVVISPALLSATPQATQARGTHADLSAAKSLGSKTAPIELEIFSDFQCPVCRQFYFSTTKQVIDEYVSTGKVYLVHRDFPLPMHAHSSEAAKWADAAAAIGKFQEVEDALYSKQDAWGATGKIDESLSSVLGPTDMKRVHALLDSPEVTASIQHDEDLGKERNITGTPSIFLTHKGQTVSLPALGTSYNLLKQYMDYLLRQ